MDENTARAIELIGQAITLLEAVDTDRETRRAIDQLYSAMDELQEDPNE